MQIHRLHSDVSVTGFIEPGALPMIADAGFRVIVCNRPDGEGENQPPFFDMQAAAKQHDIHCVYLPVFDLIADSSVAQAFDELMSGERKPILAYCKTGKRSAILWARHAVSRQPKDDIVNHMLGFGFDIAPHLP